MSGQNSSWQNFGGGGHQQQPHPRQDQPTSGNGMVSGLMNPPIRRQPSMHSTNLLGIRGGEMNNNDRTNSSRQLAASNSMAMSASRQRFQQQGEYDSGANNSSGMTNAVFPMSNQQQQLARHGSSQNLNGNSVFSRSASHSRMSQQSNSAVAPSGQNALFPLASRQQQQQNNDGMINRFASTGDLGGRAAISSKGSSSQFVASSSSISSGSSPLVAALSRKINSSSVFNQQQTSSTQGMGSANSSFPISQLLASNKQKSSTSLTALGRNNNNSSIGNFSSTMGPPSLSNSNRTSSVLNARLSVSEIDNSGSHNLRNSLSMSAIGRMNQGQRSLGARTSSISNRLFGVGGVPSASSQLNVSMSQSPSKIGGNASFSSSLASRLSQSTTSMGGIIRPSSSQSSMSAVQSNMAMLLNRNQQQQQNGNSPFNLQQQQQLQSRKRTLPQTNLASAAASKAPRSLTNATARRNFATMNSDSLLHNSCKLYPKTLVVLESALAFDPDAIRRSVPLLVGNPEEKKKKGDEEDTEGKQVLPLQFPSAATTEIGDKSSSSFKSASWYSYPFNIAMKHDAGLDVLTLLAKEGPDVLAKTDGDEEGGSLGIALGMEKPSLDIVRLILANNPATKNVADRQSNLPLHIAVRAPLESPADRMELVRLIYAAYPEAIHERNFRGETPLDVAVRSPFACDAVIDFLQQKSIPDEESELVDAPLPFS
ncbi:hypothetical protein ACA910_011305 [Epithemia clementina (nom. ined.)]